MTEITELDDVVAQINDLESEKRAIECRLDKLYSIVDIMESEEEDEE